MSLSRDSKAERQWKAIRRAEFRLRQTLDRIDWEESVLIPEIEKLKSGKGVAQIPEGAIFEIQAVHEDPRQDQDTDASE